MTGAEGKNAGLTAEVTARAIVAACMLLGVSPETAFETTPRKGREKNAPGSFSARVLAAHGLRARLGASPTTLGRVLGIHPNTIAPSQRVKYGITTDQLLAVSEALGPIVGDDPGKRFLEPMSGVPTRPCPKPEARSPKPEARSPKPEARSPKPEAERCAA